MVALQPDAVGDIEQEFHTGWGLWPAVRNVAELNEPVDARPKGASPQHLFQGTKAAVNIADDVGFHKALYACWAIRSALASVTSLILSIRKSRWGRLDSGISLAAGQWRNLAVPVAGSASLSPRCRHKPRRCRLPHQIPGDRGYPGLLPPEWY